MRLKHNAKRLYRACTASTKRRALYAVPASFGLFFYGTMFFGGVAAGANAAVTGAGIEQLLATVNASRFELWMKFADEGAVSKVLFGLIYPIIALSFVALTTGVQLGYAVPHAGYGYVISGINILWPVVGLGLIVLQFIRFIDLYRG